MRERIGPVAFFKVATIVKRLPKTRSGKILRGTIKRIADGVEYRIPPTIDDPAILDEITADLTALGYGHRAATAVLSFVSSAPFIVASFSLGRIPQASGIGASISPICSEMCCGQKATIVSVPVQQCGKPSLPSGRIRSRPIKRMF